MNLGPLHFNSFALWLLPPVLLALLVFRFYRTRRQDVRAGSLLIWRRLALNQPKVRPKRIVWDLSLLLQAAALTALIAALAAPTLARSGAGGRRILIVLDNGPLSRARLPNGRQLWDFIRDDAGKTIAALNSNDTVSLACAAPIQKVLANGGPAAALAALATIRPALSGPDTETLWGFAADKARSHADPESMPQFLIISLRDRTAQPSSDIHWRCVAPANAAIQNVGIVGFGSLPVLIEGQSQGEVQILVRIKNFSALPVEGAVKFEDDWNGVKAKSEEKPVTLAANSEEAVFFAVPGNALHPIWISWHRKDNAKDALPDDDTIYALPRPISAPKVRFHGAAPTLENLYRKALDATLLKADSKETCDLEIYTGSVPENIDEHSRGLMLLAPESGYRSIFDIGNGVLNWPKPQRDQDDPELTAGLSDKPEGIFPIAKACEIRTTGNLRSLLKDSASNRPLVARFADEKGRPGFLFAFVPGSGFALEKPLEPELAAVLVRAARVAAGAGEPFTLNRAEFAERQTGAALPEDWYTGENKVTLGGMGVLDAEASTLILGHANPREFSNAAVSTEPIRQGDTWDLTPLLIAIVLVLCALELWKEVKE